MSYAWKVFVFFVFFFDPHLCLKSQNSLFCVLFVFCTFTRVNSVTVIIVLTMNSTGPPSEKNSPQPQSSIDIWQRNCWFVTISLMFCLCNEYMIRTWVINHYYCTPFFINAFLILFFTNNISNDLLYSLFSFRCWSILSFHSNFWSYIIPLWAVNKLNRAKY